MPKIKLLVSRTGGQNTGDVIDVGAEEAQRMIDAGQAEFVRAKAAEKTVKGLKSEKAAK